MYTDYSFGDVTTVIKHPSVGQLSIYGKGIGSITFAMANDVSSQDVAADGSVMTSKIEAENGTVAISVQQTSDAHKWLTKLYNYLKTADSSEWSQTSLITTSPMMQATHEATNMSIQKRSDKPYQQQGQQVTWTFLAGNLKEY